MRQIGKHRFCDWPTDTMLGEVARCNEIASHLVYDPEEFWICNEHYEQYKVIHEKSLLPTEKEQQP